MDASSTTEFEAAAFRRLLEHLRAHPEAQHIDLMIHADFCRNCLAKWYHTAAEERGVSLDYAAVLELVYGMPYAEWKARFQTPATPEQLRAFEAKQKAAEKQ
jgi:hypothetical protein